MLYSADFKGKSNVFLLTVCFCLAPVRWQKSGAAHLQFPSFESVSCGCMSISDNRYQFVQSEFVTGSYDGCSNGIPEIVRY